MPLVPDSQEHRGCAIGHVYFVVLTGIVFDLHEFVIFWIYSLVHFKSLLNVIDFIYKILFMDAFLTQEHLRGLTTCVVSSS